MRKKFMVALMVEAFIVFVALALLGLQLLKPYTFDAVEANLREEMEARAKVIVASVAAQSVEPILDGDEVVLGLIVAKAAKEYEGMKWASIADTDVGIIAHTDLDLVGKKMTLPVGIQPRTEGDFMSGFYGTRDELLWAAYPITIGDSRQGTVHIGMSAGTQVVHTLAEAANRRALTVFAILGAISALILSILSSIPLRKLSVQAAPSIRAVATQGEEEVAERIAKKKKEETEITERIRRMRNKETELIEKIKGLKAQAEATEKGGEVEAPPQFVSEKERIESIRKRIKELEERMRSE